MLSVREYADKQGVTIQAIYQSLKSKENAERLKGHIFMENGRKMLDETAVNILDESRNQNPVVIMQANESERIADLERENEKLTAAYMELQDQLIKKQDAILRVQNKLIQAKENESLLIQKENDISLLNKQIDELLDKLETEKQKTWWDKLLKR